MRKALIILILFIFLTPLGILFVWNYGPAYAEWDHIGNWYPQQFYTFAPLPDYDISGWNTPFLASLGYIISAFVGVLAIFSIMYIFALAKRK